MMIVSSLVDTVVNTTPAPDSVPPVAKDATTDFSKLVGAPADPLTDAEATATPALPVNIPPVNATDTPNQNNDAALSPYFPYDLSFLQAQINAAMQPTPPPTAAAEETLETAVKTAVVNTTTVVENALPNANTKPNLPVTNTSIVPSLMTDEMLDLDTDVLPITPEQPLREATTTAKLPEHHALQQFTDLQTTDSQSQAPSTIIPTTDNTNPLPLDNKYASALSQLGQMINAHTAQHASNDATPVNSVYTNTAESVKKATQPEFETRVEITPVMLDAVAKDTYSANIKIYPPELGHVTAKLKVDKNNAELVILAENNVVKQIIEANLQELRQNFQNADISLTTIHVQTALSDAHGQENQQNQKSNQANTQHGLDAETVAAQDSQPAARRMDSIIDAYA